VYIKHKFKQGDSLHCYNSKTVEIVLTSKCLFLRDLGALVKKFGQKWNVNK